MFQQRFTAYKLSVSADDRFQKGFALHCDGSLEQARVLYEDTLRIQADHCDALHFLGIIEDKSGNSARAVELIGKSIALNADNPASYLNLGNAQINLSQYHEALASFEAALFRKPDYALAYLGKGVALEHLRDLDAAISCFDLALSIDSNLALAHFNRGNALRELREFDAAAKAYDSALSIDPNFATAFLNRGSAQWAMKQFDAAIFSFDRAIELRPGMADAYKNKASVLLLTGGFEAGWKLYEWRWKVPVASLPKRRSNAPLWLGTESLRDKTIFVSAEQGLGDCIQFSRYVQLLSSSGARVALETPPQLLPLMRTLDGVDEVISTSSPVPVHDFQIPVMSLPLAFGTHLNTIPSYPYYMRSDPMRLTRWSERLGPRLSKRVGLVWCGNPNYADDGSRSIALSSLVSCLPEGFDYFSLQKEVHAVDQSTLDSHPFLRHFGDELSDFGDTAALCDLMDLVISVDTGVAHLSAALGRPTWIMLPHIPDWRWLLDRTDSPWYPSVKLFRQKRPFDWSTVFEPVRSGLIAMNESAKSRQTC